MKTVEVTIRFTVPSVYRFDAIVEVATELASRARDRHDDADVVSLIIEDEEGKEEDA